MMRKKSVWHCHESLNGPSFFMSFTRWMIRNTTSKTISVSQFTKKHWAQDNPVLNDKIETINNGIDPLPITNKKVSGERRKEDEIHIGIIARITAQKGVFYAIDVLAELRKHTSKSVKFIWVGDAVPTDKKTMPKLESKIRQMGLEADFLLPGFRTDIGDFLNEVDIYFHPNVENDSFPTTILEAMYASLPVVAGNQGGATEMIIDGETGYLVSTSTVDDSVNKLQVLIENEALRNQMGSSAYTRMTQKFTREQFSETINLAFH
jgi:glycosyltransferase involved in cell wall biosynthesis